MPNPKIATGVFMVGYSRDVILTSCEGAFTARTVLRNGRPNPSK